MQKRGQRWHRYKNGEKMPGLDGMGYFGVFGNWVKRDLGGQ